MPNQWTIEDLSNTHWVNVQAALSQIADIEASAPDFDFASYAAKFVALPETKHVGLSELSAEAQDFFEQLDQLHQSKPVFALKLIAILQRTQECTHYSKIFATRISQTLCDWLLDTSLPEKQRISWAVDCWKRWRAQSYTAGNVFNAPLFTLLTQQAATDPAYATQCLEEIKSVDRNASYGYIFSVFDENIEIFLDFARKVEHLQPLCLIDGLMRLLFEAAHPYGKKSLPSDEYQRAGANKLYNIVENRPLKQDKSEHIYRYLILYTQMDQPWYHNLHGKLWAIECSKPQTERSWSNHQIVCINAPADIQILHAARASYASLLNAYQSEALNKEYIIEHTEKIIKEINDALHQEYPVTRNRALQKPSHSGLIEDCITIYWQMIEWLYKNNYELYFYALETAIENNSAPVPLSENLSKLSTQLLLRDYLTFAKQDLSAASELMAYMVSRSGFNGSENRVRPVLDIIYPMLCTINPQQAKQAVVEGKKNVRQGTFMRLWSPLNQ